jgi:LPS O-antigen subunit length determinant protein (WzzB/FepE family)
MKKNTIDDEQNFNIIELLTILWNGKKIVIATTLISLAISGIYLFYEKNKYVSLMYYSVNNIQGSTLTMRERFKDERDQFLADQAFKKSFYKKKYFDEWSANNVSSKLMYDDFRLNYNLNGIEYLKTGEFEAQFSSKIEKWITLRTNDKDKINDYFSYASFINNVVTNSYINSAVKNKEMYFNLKTKLTDTGMSVNNYFLRDEIELKSYIDQLKVNKIVSLSRPTIPQKESPNNKQIITIGFIFGFLTGFIYVILSHSYRKIKQIINN